MSLREVDARVGYGDPVCLHIPDEGYPDAYTVIRFVRVDSGGARVERNMMLCRTCAETFDQLLERAVVTRAPSDKPAREGR